MTTKQYLAAIKALGLILLHISIRLDSDSWR